MPEAGPSAGQQGWTPWAQPYHPRPTPRTCPTDLPRWTCASAGPAPPPRPGVAGHLSPRGGAGNKDRTRPLPPRPGALTSGSQAGGRRQHRPPGRPGPRPPNPRPVPRPVPQPAAAPAYCACQAAGSAGTRSSRLGSDARARSLRRVGGPPVGGASAAARGVHSAAAGEAGPVRHQRRR